MIGFESLNNIDLFVYLQAVYSVNNLLRTCQLLTKNTYHIMKNILTMLDSCSYNGPNEQKNKKVIFILDLST